MLELTRALFVTLFIVGIMSSLHVLISKFLLKVDNDGKLDEKTGCFLVRPGLYFFEGMGFILKYIVIWGVVTLILMYAK